MSPTDSVMLFYARWSVFFWRGQKEPVLVHRNKAKPNALFLDKSFLFSLICVPQMCFVKYIYIKLISLINISLPVSLEKEV